jgi:hypothetical protein
VSGDPTHAVRSAAARLAGLHRYRTPAPEADADARRDLTAAVLARDIHRGLAARPALTEDQPSERAALLIQGR